LDVFPEGSCCFRAKKLGDLSLWDFGGIRRIVEIALLNAENSANCKGAYDWLNLQD